MLELGQVTLFELCSYSIKGKDLVVSLITRMITVQETFDPRAPLVPERVLYTRPRAEMDKVGLAHLSQLLHLAKPLEEYQAH